MRVRLIPGTASVGLPQQLSIFDAPPPGVVPRRLARIPLEPPLRPFNGADYVAPRDDVRLQGQQLRIWELMRDGRWRTLADISQATGDPEASISAQLRHLRKPRFGAFLVDKEHLGSGLYQYRVRVSE